MKYLILVLFLAGCADNDRAGVQVAMTERNVDGNKYVPLTYEQAREVCGIKKAE